MSSGAGAGLTFLGTGAGEKQGDSDHLWFSVYTKCREIGKAGRRLFLRLEPALNVGK